MKALSEIELQLSRLGLKNRFWGKPEVRELQHILTHDEIITNAVNGRYEGGFALLLSTDRRLLLIDKKIWFMSMEDVRFDMISEVDYSARLLDATISIRTINKIMRFTSFKQTNLRALTTYIQFRVMELRHQVQQQYDPQSQTQPLGQAQSNQPVAPQYSVGQFVQPQQPVSRLPLRPFKRLGAYPTASFTIHRRF